MPLNIENPAHLRQLSEADQKRVKAIIDGSQTAGGPNYSATLTSVFDLQRLADDPISFLQAIRAPLEIVQSVATSLGPLIEGPTGGAGDGASGTTTVTSPEQTTNVIESPTILPFPGEGGGSGGPTAFTGRDSFSFEDGGNIFDISGDIVPGPGPDIFDGPVLGPGTGGPGEGGPTDGLIRLPDGTFQGPDGIIFDISGDIVFNPGDSDPIIPPGGGGDPIILPGGGGGGDDPIVPGPGGGTGGGFSLDDLFSDPRFAEMFGSGNQSLIDLISGFHPQDPTDPDSDAGAGGVLPGSEDLDEFVTGGDDLGFGGGEGGEGGSIFDAGETATFDAPNFDPIIDDRDAFREPLTDLILGNIGANDLLGERFVGRLDEENPFAAGEGSILAEIEGMIGRDADKRRGILENRLSVLNKLDTPLLKEQLGEFEGSVLDTLGNARIGFGLERARSEEGFRRNSLADLLNFNQTNINNVGRGLESAGRDVTQQIDERDSIFNNLLSDLQFGTSFNNLVTGSQSDFSDSGLNFAQNFLSGTGASGNTAGANAANIFGNVATRNRNSGLDLSALTTILSDPNFNL